MSLSPTATQIDGLASYYGVSKEEVVILLDIDVGIEDPEDS